jgi:hypothetical protein
VALCALEWPLTGARPGSLFGSSVSGNFATSMAFVAEGDLVTAVDDGELAFVLDEGSDAASRIPSTIGSYVILEHPRGIAAVYGELAAGSASSYLSKVRKGSILGKAGASGMAKGQGLAFSLLDRGAGRWINPLLLLPPLPDKSPPVIRSAVLLRDGKTWTLGETRSLPQGMYSFAVDVQDPLDASWTPGPSAPYFLRLVVDGVKVAELSFDVAAAPKGRLLVGSGNQLSHDDCYLPDGKTLLATRLFPRGRTVLQVLARDYAGNERQVSWTLNVE